MHSATTTCTRQAKLPTHLPAARPCSKYVVASARFRPAKSSAAKWQTGSAAPCPSWNCPRARLKCPYSLRKILLCASSLKKSSVVLTERVELSDKGSMKVEIMVYCFVNSELSSGKELLKGAASSVDFENLGTITMIDMSEAQEFENALELLKKYQGSHCLHCTRSVPHVPLRCYRRRGR